MSNTGRKIYQFLKQINVSTGLPTGEVKANVTGDPDYVAPVTDYTTCPLVAWKAADEACVTVPSCADGFTFDSTTNTCKAPEVVPATPPSSGTAGVVARVNNAQWNDAGAKLFAPGFDPTTGNGTVVSTLTTPHFWVNGNFPFDIAGRNTTDGRMNACAIWDAAGAMSGAPYGEYIGVVFKVTVPSARTYYIGIAADNEFLVHLNGQLFCQGYMIAGQNNFNFFNIYPISLVAGDNYIEMWGNNLGSAGGFGAEIYNNTAAQITAATNVGGLNIVFSTASLVGQNFNLGTTIGWSCPTGFALDPTVSGPPVCRGIISSVPLFLRTGMKEYENRQRITNGVADGYVEANSSTGGIGPYFPPVSDPINCPPQT